MKAEELKKLADDLNAIGYEILGVEPLPWSYDNSPRKILNGAYSIKVLSRGSTEAGMTNNYEIPKRE
jgi:hypothetical protein